MTDCKEILAMLQSSETDVLREGAYLAGITDDYDKIIKLDFEDGNYFSQRDLMWEWNLGELCMVDKPVILTC